MSDVVNLVLLQELWCHDPRAVLDNLVDPLAVSDSLCALHARQDSETFASVGLLVARHADEKVDVRESLLGLLELAHVAQVKQIKHTVSVDPDGPSSGRVFCLVAHGMRQSSDGRRRHGFLGLALILHILEGRVFLVLLGDAVGNVNAGLSRVTGLARVGDLITRTGNGRVVAGSKPLGRVRGAAVGDRVGGLAVGEPVGLGGSGVALFARGVPRRRLEQLVLVHGGGGGGAGGGRTLALGGTGRAC